MSSHDRIANRQVNGHPAAGLHDDIEQQTRRVVSQAHKDVRQKGTHNGVRQLLARFDRDDPTSLRPPVAVGFALLEAREGLAVGEASVGQGYRSSRTSTAQA
ncbi:phage tail protein [Streptomyces lancefieldiae]|uniref:Phage tail protein n=1 Tax=Streptomyces lancefieldiae TaxID=3075520 RepID=A0ABU3AXV7_9ACTN|nr:phage tail protein [Streptomyces sp. DSM 40712]MDT0615026.1 phage tail protein [Streptomyces sp. DSM 40712]